ncbi:MAG: Gfo/Idh/MocA family oxidoreductase [bacterium]|jgi:biliverdin reductase|nr:Gfo/Idh/MocA family oxidoreductase [bacterium]
MRKIRLGLIGSGGMAARNAQIFSNSSGFSLSAIAARNPETGLALAHKYTVDYVPQWQTLLAHRDIDGIIIASNNDSHGQMILAAMDAGKHVFCEYPIARDLGELRRIEGKLAESPTVIRVSHHEPLSVSHQTLKLQAQQMGGLLSAFFTRLTPGRGARPETLLNLPTSGPPSLFFVYHVYPIIDIFGPPIWVKAGARYSDLKETGQYHRFVNSVIAGFRDGALAQWNWAGGIEIESAEEYRRIVMTDGTLLQSGESWQISTSNGTQPLAHSQRVEKTLADQFRDDIGGQTTWQRDTQVAIDAARVGLAAEQSVNDQSCIEINSSTGTDPE